MSDKDIRNQGNELKSFEDHLLTSKTKDEIQVHSDASSGEVARAGVAQDAGYTLTGDFNLADGHYKVSGDEEHTVYAVRENGKFAGMYLHVEPWAPAAFAEELKDMQERVDTVRKMDPKAEYPGRHVAAWIATFMDMNHGVHPHKNPIEFDKKLAELFPECFLSKEALDKARGIKI